MESWSSLNMEIGNRIYWPSFVYESTFETIRSVQPGSRWFSMFVVVCLKYDNGKLFKANCCLFAWCSFFLAEIGQFCLFETTMLNRLYVRFLFILFLTALWSFLDYLVTFCGGWGEGFYLEDTGVYIANVVIIILRANCRTRNWLQDISFRNSLSYRAPFDYSMSLQLWYNG